MGKWCGNIGCGEYDSKEKCGCHLHGEYAYDCIDFTEGEEPQNLPTADVKPTLSEVLAKMQDKSSFNGWGVEFVAIDYVKQILSEYFA